jgi:uncharacterized membrane protein
MPRLLAVVLTVGSAAWVAILLAAAVVPDPGFADLVHQFAAAVCHQRPERSFAIDARPLAVCARCFGLYLSGAAGAVVAWMGGRSVPRHTRMLLLLTAAPTIATIPMEWLGFSPLSNAIRAAAALPFGAAAGWSFVRALRAE